MPNDPLPGLTPSQLDFFRENGYLVLPAALRPETVAGLLSETHRLLDSFSLDNHPMTHFSTGERTEHVGDDYFLTSGDKIRFFFEEDAFASDDSETTAESAARSGPGPSKKLARPKALAVNKIGHYLHVLSPPFARLLRPDADEPSSPAGIARSLGFVDPRCLQSMVICKQPEIGGAVPPHQDSTFLYTNPPSAVGFWYALEDATLENGCLSFLPGSHKWAPISKRLLRKSDDAGTEITDHDGPQFPAGDAYSTELEPKATDYVSAEVKAGTLVLIHGNLLHKSEKNLSQKGRIIYTFHIIEAEGTQYDGKNWLQPPEAGFTKVYELAAQA